MTFFEMTAINQLMPANAGYKLSCKFTGVNPLTNTNYTAYAAFNSVTIQGRVHHAERRTGVNGDFVTVTLISNLTTDGQELLVTFNDSNGIMGTFEKGKMPNGRIITVTGHIETVRETWTDTNGQVNLLQRAEIRLKQAVILDGGYGMMPKDKAAVSRKGVTVVRPSDAKKEEAAPVDEAPVAEAPVDDTPAMVFAGVPDVKATAEEPF